MKKGLFILVLLILPVTLIILGLMFKASRGDFFLNWQYDPSYIYLINSLNLSQFNNYGVGHIDHPGTTVQIIGAVVVRIVHTFQNAHINIITDVFSRPEFFLSKINTVFVIMTGAALFILGFSVYVTLNNIFAALSLQTTPFYFLIIYTALSNVSPEPLLIFTIVLFIAVAVCYSSNQNLSGKNSLKYVIAFSLLSGFGLATKLTFFPFLIIPMLLIKRVSTNFLYLVSTLVAFLIFVSSVISTQNIEYFLYWIETLTTHSGIYGTGPENYIDVPTFIKNLNTIFISEFIFSFSYALMFVLLILQFFGKFKRQIRTNKYYKLLIGIFIVLTIQVLLVAKHYGPHYLLPAFMLSVPGLFVINSIIADLFPKYFVKKEFIYLFLILFCFLCIKMNSIINEINLNTQRRNESYKLVNYLENNCKNSFIINSYGSSSKEFGLFLGVYYSGSQKSRYLLELRNQFPNYLHYNKFSEDFNYEDIDDFKSKLTNANKFVFQSDRKDLINNFMKQLKSATNKPNANYKLLFSNLFDETIYEITLDP